MEIASVGDIGKSASCSEHCMTVHFLTGRSRGQVITVAIGNGEAEATGITRCHVPRRLMEVIEQLHSCSTHHRSIPELHQRTRGSVLLGHN